MPTPSTTDGLSLIHISGDKDLQQRLRTLYTEFKDIFSNELPAAPAKIPDFHLVVKEADWKLLSLRDKFSMLASSVQLVSYIVVITYVQYST